ncbi:MAG: glycogen/starch/alpha-glucan phosphorylase, partial [Pseudomonadota bacterium]|nr:glycogen/starch/alpha-glucan phosphorylase [Pseudomonadota bacterium]
GYGYGIRYEYGMFTQKIEDGLQVERPDNWLRYGNPWEFPRPEVLYQVRFFGRCVNYQDEQGTNRSSWIETEDVLAMAYDTPIPGYGGHTVNNMRLWTAKGTRDFNLGSFNEGNYMGAVENKFNSELLSKVLYPSDKTSLGRELRLKQEYFFVSASIQDVLYRFTKIFDDLRLLPEKVAIQLNDTHPSLGITELMRILVDIHRLEWEAAWNITRKIFSYTNHTLMPEALETWEVRLFETMLPRHLQIIYEINRRFLDHVQQVFPGNIDMQRRISLIDENDGKRVRMANLAIVGSHKVNGVASIHSQLLREKVFPDFNQLFPDKFINITNGITQRLWFNQANPKLAELVSQHIGTDWLRDLEKLRAIEPLAEHPDFRKAFMNIKHENKGELLDLLRLHTPVSIDPHSMFDVQCKRIHEYKRQLLNLLHVITRYNRLRRGQTTGVSRTVIFSGKAAPSYTIAKLIIRLIHDVAKTVNHDLRTRDMLKVVFIANYDVSTALRLIPAADLSEQISTAGTEASGTGNMKLALNGALTIGTLDGANIEIREAVGEDNIFIFGLDALQVEDLRSQGYACREYYQNNDELKEVIDMIESGYFCPQEPDRYKPLINNLFSSNDHYLLMADYASYIHCQDKVDKLYSQPEDWTKQAILNTARMGYFSSDRAIREYAKLIWNIEPVQVS